MRYGSRTMRCARIFYDHFPSSLLLRMSVKEFWKLLYIFIELWHQFWYISLDRLIESYFAKDHGQSHMKQKFIRMHMIVLIWVYAAVGNTEEADDQRRSSGQIWKANGQDSKGLEKGLHWLQVYSSGLDINTRQIQEAQLWLGWPIILRGILWDTCCLMENGGLALEGLDGHW